MQSDYPLSRCPACKKAFRMEITRLASPPPNLGQFACATPNLGLIVCPNCGLKFQRFDPQYLRGPARHATAR
jgi:transcription elongation factor Elf1